VSCKAISSKTAITIRHTTAIHQQIPIITLQWVFTQQLSSLRSNLVTAFKYGWDRFKHELIWFSCDLPGTSSCSTCISSCLAGQYMDGCGGMSKGSCQACPSGTFSSPGKHAHWFYHCELSSITLLVIWSIQLLPESTNWVFKSVIDPLSQIVRTLISKLTKGCQRQPPLARQYFAAELYRFDFIV
jgi:hypothetical protein